MFLIFCNGHAIRLNYLMNVGLYLCSLRVHNCQEVSVHTLHVCACEQFCCSSKSWNAFPLLLER